ncbi:uncharacterized protein MYCFIDRAFT_37548 [Pseudocercospora fijiensis CIRAD86]|uniref:Uncharacterized protein n=1 Tax=Pseudocercospora fijiensis (strain CIRAD86) TaxID=383855 RepID=M2YPX5_PSEFD|nr:uncharacterized protein MYCFIDRAFT_37548 [Pseudocercospora fijiensis CIRAD86]EME79760.1 hypothetical protein MYCFIDRAFT_37548 [Pseudocercospora fijiensis CIRAD86]
MPSLSSVYTQMWPPKPNFREEDIPDLCGKVCIVTGGSSGVGKEVVRILYSKNATVYIGARSEERANCAIRDAKRLAPENSKGVLLFLHMDFSDLRTIKPAVENFKKLEQGKNQLHILINNAGIQASDNRKTAQDWEIHFGVNVLAPFLLTQLLTPTMLDTAKTDPDVRVVWVGSLSVELLGERSRGISRDFLEYWRQISPLERYGISKASAWLHGAEMARRFPEITSIICNPGHLKSDLYREQNKLLQCVLRTLILYPPVYGALTELTAAVSPTVGKQDSGRWMIPWGRWQPIRSDLMDAVKAVADGGNGHAQEFWDWCSVQCAAFM